jgi:NAD(P)-dependent dehydrogenase (short-subunit alcohol dehydrogenase family)
MTATAPVALITGGARRIGRAIADDLSRHGWSVAIHCHHSRAEAEALSNEISARGAKAAVIVADLANPSGARSVVRGAQSALGPVTLLVNNASIFEADGIGQLDAELWQRQMSINLASPVFLADAFAAALPTKTEGNVVNIVDQRVWKPTPHYMSYHLSKAGLLAATRTLAQALAPRIRVNAIGPGPTLPSPRQRQSDFDRQAAAIPLQRATDLADFGRTIRFLVATPSITGQMIALDGGQHIAWQTPDILGASE